MTDAEIKTTAATIPATGSATSRYASVRFGLPCFSFAASTTPRMPSNKLTANESSVTMKVASSMRTGIKYQRGSAEPDFIEEDSSLIRSSVQQKRRLILNEGCAHFA